MSPWSELKRGIKSMLSSSSRRANHQKPIHLGEKGNFSIGLCSSKQIAYPVKDKGSHYYSICSVWNVLVSQSTEPSIINRLRIHTLKIKGRWSCPPSSSVIYSTTTNIPIMKLIRELMIPLSLTDLFFWVVLVELYHPFFFKMTASHE